MKPFLIKTTAVFLALLFVFVVPEAHANAIKKEEILSTLKQAIYLKSSLGETIEIKAGTAIEFKTIEELSSDKLIQGQLIKLKVAKDVVVNGKTVISYGSIANGKIIHLKKRKIAGIGGEIEILVQSVQSADGTIINIEGGKYFNEGDDRKGLAWGLFAISFLFLWPLILSPLFVRGKHAIIKEGTTIIGNVAQNVTISVN